MTYPVYTYETAAGATATGSVTPTLPTTLNGRLMLAFVGSANAVSDVVNTPTGWTPLVAGVNNTTKLFGRIGTNFESAPTFTFADGYNTTWAFIVAVTSTTGFPTIGSVVTDSAAGTGFVTGQNYGALTVTQEGRAGLQFAAKNLTNGGTNPVTAITVTSSWTAAGTAIQNTAYGIAASAQSVDTLPTVAGDIAANAEATTGNTDLEFARWITLTITGVQTTGPLYTYDASHRETSPYSGLPLSLLSRIGSFDTDDSYQQNGDETPAGADFTIGDFGVLTLVTLPVSIPFIFNDASTGEDYTYTLSFSLPSPGSAIRGGGVSISTGYGKLHTLNKIRGGGLSAAMGGGFITLSGGRTVPFTANLNDAFIVPVIFAELEFDSQTRYLHNDLGTITTLGHDWTGVGTFGSIEPLQERDDQSPTGTTLRLSGIDSVLLEEALVENYRDRPVTIYLGIRDATTGALTTAPMELFTGRMDQMRASAGGQTMSVEIVVESEMIDFQKALMRYFSDSELQALYPGALGFQYLASMTNARITIGSKETIHFGQTKK